MVRGHLLLRQGKRRAASRGFSCRDRLVRASARCLSEPPSAELGPFDRRIPGLCVCERGPAGEGVVLLEQATEHAERMHLSASYAMWLTYLGVSYLSLGRHAEARRSARRPSRMLASMASAVTRPGRSSCWRRWTRGRGPPLPGPTRCLPRPSTWRERSGCARCSRIATPRRPSCMRILVAGIERPRRGRGRRPFATRSA